VRLLPALAVSLLLAGAAPAQTTVDNDDSCDIGLAPAATLLLPYFRVDASRRAVADHVDGGVAGGMLVCVSPRSIRGST
jgi:hypothetical protein